MTAEQLARVFAGESLQEPYQPAPSGVDPRLTDDLDCDHMPDGQPFGPPIHTGLLEEQLAGREVRFKKPSLDQWLGGAQPGYILFATGHADQPSTDESDAF